LVVAGAVTAGIGVVLLTGGFIAFSILVAAAGANDSSGDGTVAVVAFLVGAAAAVTGVSLLLIALVRRHRG